MQTSVSVRFVCHRDEPRSQPVPDSVFKKTDVIKEYFAASYTYVSSLKPKPTTRKKSTKKVAGKKKATKKKAVAKSPKMKKVKLANKKKAAKKKK